MLGKFWRFLTGIFSGAGPDNLWQSEDRDMAEALRERDAKH